MVVGPALQRGVAKPRIHLESSRDGAHALGPSNVLGRVTPVSNHDVSAPEPALSFVDGSLAFGDRRLRSGSQVSTCKNAKVSRRPAAKLRPIPNLAQPAWAEYQATVICTRSSVIGLPARTRTANKSEINNALSTT